MPAPLVIDRRSVAGNAAGSVTVTPPVGAPQTATLSSAGPGRATIRLPAQAPGVWQVSDGVHLAFAAVGLDNPLEYADLRATADRMHKLVTESGGGVAWLANGIPELRRVDENATASGPGWMGLVKRGAHLVTGVSTVPLLPPYLALPILLGLVVGAWRREAR